MYNINKLIYTGPLCKPSLYDSQFFTLIYEKEERKKEFQLCWQDIYSKIKSNIIDPYHNDRYKRMKDLLYIWFLTEPKKVLCAIAEVKKQAAEIGSQSFKALNITLNK